MKKQSEGLQREFDAVAEKLAKAVILLLSKAGQGGNERAFAGEEWRWQEGRLNLAPSFWRTFITVISLNPVAAA